MNVVVRTRNKDIFNLFGKIKLNHFSGSATDDHQLIFLHRLNLQIDSWKKHYIYLCVWSSNDSCSIIIFIVFNASDCERLKSAATAFPYVMTPVIKGCGTNQISS